MEYWNVDFQEELLIFASFISMSKGCEKGKK